MAKVVVAGLVRNGEHSIEGEYLKILGAFSGQNLVRTVFVESDSIDGTVGILQGMESKYTGFAQISLGQLQEIYSKRTERIAYCRNIYLEYLRRFSYFGADFLFVTDLDGVNESLKAQAVNDVLLFLEQTPGAAACANQSYRYYDIWALRHPEWSHNDCWKAYHDLKHIMGESIAKNYCISSRMIHLGENLAPFVVDSAFGGGALYPVKYLKDLEYVGISDGDEVCEHVSFSHGYRNNGGRLFIVPAFINHDVSEHVRVLE